MLEERIKIFCSEEIGERFIEGIKELLIMLLPIILKALPFIVAVFIYFIIRIIVNKIRWWRLF